MIRYGIIGSGMMGLEHIMNLQHLDGATITAVADPHEPSRQAAAHLLAGEDVAYLEDHADLVSSGLVDAVVLATPNMTHVDVLLDLLPTDLHILVEKPLCTTMEDCRRVIAAAEGRTPVTWVGLEYRYMPPVARLIEEVRAGTVGAVRMLSIREHRFPFLSKVGDWNRFSANTGGTLVEKACHFFDLMNEVIGTRPVTVMASGGQDVNHLDETYDGRRSDILDNAFVIVEYEGGARAMLDLCMFAEGGKNQSEISAVGEKGKVEAVPAVIGVRRSATRRLRRPQRRADRRGRAVLTDHRDRHRRRGALHGPSRGVELRRAHPLPRRHPRRRDTRGLAGRRAALGGDGACGPPLHRRGPRRGHVRDPRRVAGHYPLTLPARTPLTK